MTKIAVKNVPLTLMFESQIVTTNQIFQPTLQTAETHGGLTKF
jgi:hypothetical protein